MRLLSIILSFHILFLTINPVLSSTPVSSEVEQCDESCCSTSKEKQKSDKQSNDCCNSICNPFMICCNCNALTNQAQHISAPFIYSNQKFIIVSETNNFDFLSDAWNPPKMA
jgi:hypothetical protein